MSAKDLAKDLPDAVWRWTGGGPAEALNEMAEELGRVMVMPPENDPAQEAMQLEELIARMAANAEQLGDPAHIELDDGRHLSVLGRRKGDEVLVVARDESDLHHIQENLLSTSAHAALGSLAAGLAHEVNNPLTVVVGLAEILATRQDLPEGVLEDVQLIQSSSRRAAQIVRDLLCFSRAQTNLEETDFDLTQAISEVLGLLRESLEQRDVRIVLIPPPRPVWIQAPRGLLQQAILSIAQNGAEAVIDSRRGDRGEVSVVPGEDRLLVRIRDNGPGVPKDMLRRIFMPFFTTRDVGHGTGLGLVTARAALRRLGGDVHYEPAEPGAMFVVRLPASRVIDFDEPLTEHEEPANSPEEVFEEPSHARVLCIDDDEEVLHMYARILGGVGHGVTILSDGAAVVPHLEEGHDYDVILLDVHMPGTSGLDIYADLRERWPHLAQRVVLATANANTQEVAELCQAHAIHVLEKPVRIGDLLECVQRRGYTDD